MNKNINNKKFRVNKFTSNDKKAKKIVKISNLKKVIPRKIEVLNNIYNIEDKKNKNYIYSIKRNYKKTNNTEVKTNLYIDQVDIKNQIYYFQRENKKLNIHINKVIQFQKHHLNSAIIYKNNNILSKLGNNYTNYNKKEFDKELNLLQETNFKIYKIKSQIESINLLIIKKNTIIREASEKEFNQIKILKLNLIKKIKNKIIKKYILNKENGILDFNFIVKNRLINEYNSKLNNYENILDQNENKIIFNNKIINKKNYDITANQEKFESLKINYKLIMSKINKNQEEKFKEVQNIESNEKIKNDISLLNIKKLNLENEINENKIKMNNEYEDLAKEKNRLREQINLKRKKIVNRPYKKSTFEEDKVNRNNLIDKTKNEKLESKKKYKRVNLEDLYHITYKLRFKIILEEINDKLLKDLWIPEINKKTGRITIYDLNNLFHNYPFDMKNKNEIILLSRFLIEDNNEDLIIFDYNKSNSIHIVSSIFKNIIGNLDFPSTKEYENLYKKLIITINKNWNLLLTSKNYLEKKNNLPIYNIFEIFQHVGINFKKKEKNFILLILFLENNENFEIEFSKILSIFNNDRELILIKYKSKLKKRMHKKIKTSVLKNGNTNIMKNLNSSNFNEKFKNKKISDFNSIDNIIINENKKKNKKKTAFKYNININKIDNFNDMNVKEEINNQELIKYKEDDIKIKSKNCSENYSIKEEFDEDFSIKDESDNEIDKNYEISINKINNFNNENVKKEIEEQEKIVNYEINVNKINSFNDENVKKEIEGQESEKELSKSISKVEEIEEQENVINYEINVNKINNFNDVKVKEEIEEQENVINYEINVNKINNFNDVKVKEEIEEQENVINYEINVNKINNFNDVKVKEEIEEQENVINYEINVNKINNFNDDNVKKEIEGQENVVNYEINVNKINNFNDGNVKKEIEGQENVVNYEINVNKINNFNDDNVKKEIEEQENVVKKELNKSISKFKEINEKIVNYEINVNKINNFNDENVKKEIEGQENPLNNFKKNIENNNFNYEININAIENFNDENVRQEIENQENNRNSIINNIQLHSFKKETIC